MNKQVMAYIAKKKAEAAAVKQPKTVKRPRTIGLWKNEHGRLLSSPLIRSDIPPYTRLMFLKNRHKKGANSPDYIGYFVRGSKEDALKIEAPFIALLALTNDEI